MSRNLWTADFETTTDEHDCRVWAYALSNIEDYEFIYGNNIDDFFSFCENSKDNLKIWFHNLKFDGSYLLSYLLTHSYEFIEDTKDRRDRTFTTMITDMGQFYSITVYFMVKGKRVNKVTFYDSLKIFPNFSVERVAEGFGLPISKLELDYKRKRKVGHQLTEEEVNYIRNDVEIMARALHIMFEQNLTKMTIASDAMTYFRTTIQGFRKKFPKLPKEVDLDIRKSYRGGFTYVNEIYKEKQLGRGITLDVNSLYPSCMVHCFLPYDFPVAFDGKYEKDSVYPLYIQTFSCVFDIKEGKIPTIQIKNSLSFIPNEYVKSSEGEIVTLTLTKPDYELFMEHYNVRHLHYVGGWKFKQAKGIFDEYINYWTERKIKAGKEGNAPIRQISKLLLNSLYGRFSLSPTARQKAPYLDEKGVVRFNLLPEEEREPVYIPVGTFITAYGRERTIRTSQIIRDFTLKKYGEDRYYYSDTDSCHANLSDEDLEELKDIIHIDDYELGCWAKESEFTRACFIRQKCYVEEVNGKLDVTVAGLPKYLAPLITFENFAKGFTTEGLTLEEMLKIASNNGATKEDLKKIHHKLTYKYVKGGVILKDTDFTIQ